MILTVSPAECLCGRVFLPASKSYSIRASIIAACGGTSTLHHPSDCDDAVVAMSAAKALGCTVKKTGKSSYRIIRVKNIPNVSRVNVGESGTVLRFLLPLLSLYPKKFTIEGRGTLRGRPNHHLVKTLRAMGVALNGLGEKQSIPIKISGGTLRGGKYSIDGSLSSQFISALLIACPQLSQNTELMITGEKMVSGDYITMTESVLKKAGIKIQRRSARHFHVPGKQKFKGLRNFTVPSDYGLAAFLMAAAALLPSEVTLEGYLSKDFIQADGAILNFLRKMGVKFTKTDRAIKIKGPFQLRGGNFSLKDCPDLVPVMAVLALFAQGTTRLTDIAHARAKESDRISDLRKELLKVGANIEESPNALVIHPRTAYKTNVLLDPHHDHRLAMAFSVLGLKVGARIKDIECTHKSYPGFVKDFQTIGAAVKKSK